MRAAAYQRGFPASCAARSTVSKYMVRHCAIDSRWNTTAPGSNQIAPRGPLAGSILIRNHRLPVAFIQWANGPLRAAVCREAPVHNLPSLSNCIVSGIVAALVASGISGSPINFVSREQLPRPNPQVPGADVSSAKYVDRSHKSDRLPTQRADPIANTTIIKKNADTPDYIVRVTNVTPARLHTLGTG